MKDYDYIIVGAGLCGLVLAKELSARNKRVLILEKGGYVNRMGTVMRAYFFYDKHALLKSRQGVIIYRVLGVGGTSLVSCGNAVQFSEDEYQRIGIDFTNELPEAKKESCVQETGAKIGRVSRKIMDVANNLGYTMQPMPKFSFAGKCVSCGTCTVGCGFGAKWASQECLKGINLQNVDLLTGISVAKVMGVAGKAVGVEVKNKFSGKKEFFAEKVILSAGGIGTPIILENSGLNAGDNLFVDLFNVTYGLHPDFRQEKELTMSCVCTKFHQAEGFVISPFVDNWFSLASGVGLFDLGNVLRLGNLMGIMTKISDDATGKVYPNGVIEKSPTFSDSKKLKRGSDIAKEILIGCGVGPKSIFVTKIKGAHPGGTAAIGRVVDINLETQMKNLYVCDASVLPFAPGLPPMLSLIALSKWFAKRVEG